MSVPTYKTPARAFAQLRDHFNRILNTTVSDSHLILESFADREDTAMLGYQRKNKPIYGKLGTKYYLSVSQILEAVKQGRKYRPRTLSYVYKISEHAQFDVEPLFRWEYISREKKALDHPRHHFHANGSIEGTHHDFNLKRLHIPSGWVTIEEIIRFAITELRIKPRRDDWDSILRNSEERFRRDTQRSI